MSPAGAADLDLSLLAAGQIVVLSGEQGCGTTGLLTALAARPGTALLEAAPGQDWEHHDVVTAGIGPDHLLGRQLGSMSSGERQRVRLARFLAGPASTADVLLLDEPFGYLDARGIAETLTSLRATDKAVLVVCKTDHRVHEAADRLLTMSQGKVS